MTVQFPAPPGLLVQARQAFAAGHYPLARSACAKLLEADPAADEAHFILGLAAHHEDEVEAALAHFTAAVDTAFAHVAAGAEVNPIAQYVSYKAESLRRLSLLDEAVIAGRTAAALDPTMTMVWALLGAAASQQGRDGEGIVQFTRARVIGAEGRPMVARGLAACLATVGRNEEAEKVCREALIADPLDAMNHITLAEILLAQDRTVEALCEATLAAHLDFEGEHAQYTLAVTQSAAGNAEAALSSIDHVLKVNPQRADAWMLRAIFLQKLRRPGEALAAADTALAVSGGKDLHKIQNLRGEALEVLRRGDEALSAFSAALDYGQAQGFDMPGLEVKRVQLLLDLGRLDDEDGLESMNEIEGRHSGFMPAITLRADYKTFLADDPDIGRMEEALAKPDFQPEAEASLRYALGKAYLDMRDGERAFLNFDRANHLRRQNIDYDPEMADEAISRLITHYPADPWTPPAPSADRGPSTPIFIFGMPRSGTSLTEQILASHPDVYGGGEMDTLSVIAEELVKIVGTPAEIPKAPIELLEQFGQKYRDHIASISGGRRFVVDKMPPNYRNLGLIRQILPEARLIHCRRDPLDTCLSCYTKSFTDDVKFSFNQRELGLHYRGYQRLTAHWRSILPEGAWIEIDYEDTVADQEGQTRKLLDYIGLPWHDAVLSFHKTQRQVRTASTRQVRRPLYKTSVKASQPFEAYLQPLIKALAGEPDPMLTFTLGGDTATEI